MVQRSFRVISTHNSLLLTVSGDWLKIGITPLYSRHIWKTNIEKWFIDGSFHRKRSLHSALVKPESGLWPWGNRSTPMPVCIYHSAVMGNCHASISLCYASDKIHAAQLYFQICLVYWTSIFCVCTCTCTCTPDVCTTGDAGTQSQPVLWHLEFTVTVRLSLSLLPVFSLKSRSVA